MQLLFVFFLGKQPLQFRNSALWTFLLSKFSQSNQWGILLTTFAKMKLTEWTALLAVLMKHISEDQVTTREKITANLCMLDIVNSAKFPYTKLYHFHCTILVHILSCFNPWNTEIPIMANVPHMKKTGDLFAPSKLCEELLKSGYRSLASIFI